MYRGTSAFNRIGSFGKRISKPTWIPTIENLPATITLNGSDRTPAARYNAKDATASAFPVWTYGSSLGVTGSGDPTLLQPSPLRGSLDKSITYNGKYHQASVTTYCNITTEDPYLEMIVKTGTAAALIYYIYKYQTYGYTAYWSNTTSKIVMSVKDADGDTVTVQSAALSQSTWYFVQIGINRDYNDTNGGVIYINGAQSGTANPYPAAASATNPRAFAIGATSTAQIAYVSLYYAADMFSATTAGKAEMDALASTRSKLVRWW